MKKKIVVDFDSTIVKTHFAVLNLYREDTGDCSTSIDDKCVKWNMSDVCAKWSRKQIDDVFINPNLFKHMQPIENAIEVLERLHNEGYEIEICSLHKKEGIQLKIDWIKEHMPFVDSFNIIPFKNNDIVFDKSSAVGYVMIDDRVDCLESSHCDNLICFGDYSWNRCWNGVRAFNWDTVYSLIKTFEEQDKHAMESSKGNKNE